MRFVARNRCQPRRVGRGWWKRVCVVAAHRNPKGDDRQTKGLSLVFDEEPTDVIHHRRGVVVYNQRRIEIHVSPVPGRDWWEGPVRLKGGGRLGGHSGAIVVLRAKRS